MTLKETTNNRGDEDIGKVCYGWWAQLTDKKLGRMRADHARLRRADSVSVALTVYAVHRLYSELCRAGYDLKNRPDTLALIAMSLAQVQEASPETMASKMGGNPPIVSEVRFTNIIRTTDPDDLTSLIRRALRVIGQAVNVSRLSSDLMWWNETTRASWCFDYYGASNAIPKPKT